jgi:hypothetical protein
LSSVIFRGWMGNLSYSLTTDKTSFDSRQKRVIFVCSETSRPTLKGTKLHIRWEKWAVAPEISRPGREDDQTPPSIAKVKNECIYRVRQKKCIHFNRWYLLKYVYIFLADPVYLCWLIWAFKVWRGATLKFWNRYNEGLERGYISYGWSSADRNKTINKKWLHSNYRMTTYVKITEVLKF